MSIFRYLIFILLCSSMCWSCSTRYGYRSKVNAGKKENYHSKADKQELRNAEKTETTDEIISASLEKFHLIIIRPNINSLKINKDSIQTLAEDKKSINFKKDKKTELRDDEKPPINYYAKWALIMGMISLTVIPFILPIIIGPIDILLGIVSLKRISHTREKGKGRAIFAIVIGAFLLFTEIRFFYELILPVYGNLIIALLLLAVNYLLFVFIKNGNKNPENKEWVEKRKPLDKSTRHFIITAGIFALLTLTGSFLIITFGFGPITIMMAAKAIKYIPKGKSNGKTIAIISLIVGILGTIAVFIFVPWLWNIDGNYDGGYDIFYKLVALTTILITLIFTLVGFIILSLSEKSE